MALVATGSDHHSAEYSCLEPSKISYFEKQCTACTADSYEGIQECVHCAVLVHVS